MYLLEKQRLYCCKEKSKGYKMETLIQRLHILTHKDSNYELTIISKGKPLWFTLEKRTNVKYSNNWCLHGTIEETEEAIIISGYFGDKYGLSRYAFLFLLLAGCINLLHSIIVPDSASDLIMDIYMVSLASFFLLLPKLVQRKKQVQITQLIQSL